MSISRKEILQYLAGLPVLGAFAGISGGYAESVQKSVTPRRDYFNELGVRKLINARGAYTTLTGSLMPPEVVDAMQYASNHFVSLIELNEKAGARIAEMLNCEDAHVSAGAASAITLATAAALTGKDREKMRAIPHLPGPQKEVIMPRGHRIYEQQFTACGVKLVEVDSAREMERAMNENTVLAFYYNAYREQKISREDFIRIGRQHGVPTFNDCASDVPPVENLFKYIEMGFDLVTFSGGKGLSGPQSAGLLFGRKDLIEAARMNHSPYGSIGRGMKVEKEEIIGLLVALEVYLNKDHDKERAMWESWVSRLQANFSDVPGVSTEMYVPPIANHVPHLRVTWDPSVVKTTPGEIVQKLRHGHPSIEVMASEEDITLNMFMLQPHEVDILGQRTKQILMESV